MFRQLEYSLILLGILVAGLQTAPAAEQEAAGEAAGLQSSADAWPMFRGNSLATGVAKSGLPTNLELLWRYEVPKGAFEGTPAIVEGVVYLGDLDGSLFALDLQTGQELWKYTTDSGFPASPAVRDRKVYLGDYDGRLHCVEAQGGKQLWVFESNAEINSCPNFYRENVLFGSQDATLYCLNATTGELVWKFEIQDQIRCSPTLVEGRAFPRRLRRSTAHRGCRERCGPLQRANQCTDRRHSRRTRRLCLLRHRRG